LAVDETVIAILLFVAHEYTAFGKIGANEHFADAFVFDEQFAETVMTHTEPAVHGSAGDMVAVHTVVPVQNDGSPVASFIAALMLAIQLDAHELMTA
jgi:hypothetical protein